MSGFLFQFQEYLSALLSLPSNGIAVEQLSGGLTNFTSRVTFSQEICFPGSSTSVTSAIVKYAPPYIAASGPSQALSTKRQLVEANALRMFSDSREIFFHSSFLHSYIRIPTLLFHDEARNVLVMSDLGRIPTLSEFLEDSGHETVVTGHPTWLAQFLADMHYHTLRFSDEQFRPFENPESSQTIRELVGTLPRKLLRTFDFADADVLGQSVEEDMATERVEGEDRCFGMVDLWPGSILIGDGFVGLVDWEYAGKSSAGSELGMLTAHLHVPLLSSNISNVVSENIRKFTSELLQVYIQRSRLIPPNFSRLVLLSHGRELINAVEFPKDGIDARLSSTLVHAGARCLRAATCHNLTEMREKLTSDDIGLLHSILFLDT